MSIAHALRPSSLLSLLALVVLDLGSRPATSDAQVVLIPTFPVAASGVGETEQPWPIIGSDVAADPSGGVLFFWTEVLPDGSHPPRALVTRHLSSGGAGAYVRVRTDEEFLRDPAVGARPFDGFVTAWHSDGPGPNGPRVLARFHDVTGTPAGEPIEVATEGLSFSTSPAVVGLPIGAAIAWLGGQDEVHGRIFRPDGRPQTSRFTIGTARSAPIGLAALPDGAFVAGWTSDDGNGVGAGTGRVYSPAGLPLGEPFPFSEVSGFGAIATSPAGDVIAVLGGRPQGTSSAIRELWLRRTTLAGIPLADEVLVATGPLDGSLRGDLEFDLNGNLYVVWTDLGNIDSPTMARAYDTAGQPLGPPVAIDPGRAFALRTARLPDGSFLNSLGRYAEREVHANVTSLCAPGSAICGDGTRDPLCEQCDAGASNDDATPGACRTDCRPARCGDGVVDGGETCDDGNRDACDGCSRDCAPEVGLGCGDSVPFPACGELCDDGNGIDGDGCAACVLERIPGGGSERSDCHAEWSIDNAANAPRYDKRGAINAVQSCVDDDPRCDFDGGVPGSCTLAVEVCVNNTNLPACAPEFRLLAWDLRTPSANRALGDPVAAAVRASFQSVVPGAVVGPDARDLCSPRTLVTLPLKGTAARPKPYRLSLVARATLYSGATDTDKLRLVCLPAVP